jgi:hypothetical protein
MIGVMNTADQTYYIYIYYVESLLESYMSSNCFGMYAFVTTYYSRLNYAT